MNTTVKVRWQLDVVDRGGPAKLLRQDRQLRRGLQDTDRQYRRLSSSAVGAGARMTAASQRSARAHGNEARATRTLTGDLRGLSREQRRTLVGGGRLSATAHRVSQSYRTQARAARELSVAERARARAQTAAAGAGSAAASAAAGGRAARGAAGRVVGLAAAAGAGIGIAAATGDAVSFEQQMSKVQARLGATSGELRTLNDLAIDLGGKTAFNAREAAGAMYELSGAGFSVKQTIATLPGTLALASASGEDLAASAELQAGALRAFKLPVSDAAHVADVLAKTSNLSSVEMSDLGDTLKYVAPAAQATGQSLEGVSAAAGLLGNVGIKGSQAGTSLRTALLRLTDPTKKMRETFKALGVDGSKLAALPLPKVIASIAGGLKKLPTRGQKVGAISAIFGKEAAPALLELMSQGKTRLDKWADSLLNANGYAKKTAATMRNNVAGAWDEFTGSLESATLKLTRRFMPALRGALNGAAGTVTRATTDLTRVPDAVRAGQRGSGQGYTGIAGAAADVSRRVPGLGGVRGGLRAGLAGKTDQETSGYSGAGKLAVTAGRALKTVKDGALDAGAQLVDAFKPALPFLQNVLLPVITGVGKGLLASVVGAFKVVVPTIKIVATALGWIGEKAKPLRGVLEAVGMAIGFVFSGPILKGLAVIPKLGIVFKALAVPVQLVGAALGLLGKGAQKAGQWIGQHFSGTIQNLRVILAAAGTVVDDVAVKVRAGLGVAVKAAGLYVKAGVTVFKAYWGALKLVGTGAAAAGKWIGGALVRGFKTLTPAIKLAVQPLRTMYSGLRLVASGARTAVTWVGTRLAGGVKTGAKAVSGLAGRVSGTAGAIGGAAKTVVSALLRPFRIMGSGLRKAISSGFHGVVGLIGGFAKDFLAVGTRLGTGLAKAVVSAVTKGIRDSAGSIAGSIKDAVAGRVEIGGRNINPLARRRGGRTPRFAEGGLVPILAAGGEMLYENGRAYEIPGDPRRDSTLMWARPGSEIYTGHGQELLAAGASRQQALAAQLPHFAGGGKISPLRTAGLALKAGFRGASRIVATALAGAESNYMPGAIGPQTPYGRAQGLMQIMLPVHAALIRRLGGDALNPLTSMRAAHAISGGGRNWRPWEAFTNGAYRRFLAAARSAVQRSRGGSDGTTSSGATGESTIKVPRMLGRSRTRGGLLDDAFGSAFDAARSGQGLNAASRLQQVREAASGVDFTREISVSGVRAGEKKTGNVAGRASTSSWRRNATRSWANAFARRFGMRISSSYRTPAQNAAAGGVPGSFHTRGSASNPHAFDFVPPKQSALTAARRMHPRPAEAMIHDAGSGLHLHVGLYRGGGRVRRMRSGGRLARGVADARSYRGGSLADLLPIIEDAGVRALDQLRQNLLAQIRKGGTAKAVTRLQQILDLVDTSLGDRAGRLMAAVDRRNANVATVQSYRELNLRRRGLSEDSPEALREELAFQQNTVSRAAKMNLGQIRGAIKRAEKAGNKDKVAELQDALRETQLALDESLVRQVELRRDIIRASAQQRVDQAQVGADWAQGGLGSLDAVQRLNRTGDTPGGMLERSAAISSTLIPQLRGVMSALQMQHDELLRIGDIAGAQQAALAFQQTGNDIVNAMADAADLIREAAEQRAQDIVDAAAHTATMGDLSLQRLELEQRLAGTFDFGGQQRSDLIHTEIIPALQRELDALRNQQAVAQQQGDAKLANQIAEAIAGKEIDIMQRQLDAIEQVAENTSDRKIGGTAGFAYGGETLTDTIIGVGNGS